MDTCMFAIVLTIDCKYFSILIKKVSLHITLFVQCHNCVSSESLTSLKFKLQSCITISFGVYILLWDFFESIVSWNHHWTSLASDWGRFSIPSSWWCLLITRGWLPPGNCLWDKGEVICLTPMGAKSGIQYTKLLIMQFYKPEMCTNMYMYTYSACE